MKIPAPPVIWPSLCTPQEEIESIKNLQAQLIGITFSVEAWSAALALYNLTKHPPSSVSGPISSRWRFVACNECILELYHLRARLEKIQSVALRSCPSVRSRVDSGKVRSARKMLDDYFPDIEFLRHATAHRGENEAYPGIHAPDGRYALAGFRESDRFSTPFKGKMCHIDIADRSLQKIIEVVSEFFDAFRAAAIYLENQGHLE